MLKSILSGHSYPIAGYFKADNIFSFRIVKSEVNILDRDR